MKNRITESDLLRWKRNTLDLSRDLLLDWEILSRLESTSLKLLSGDSNFMFYGWAQYEPPRVEVYETNHSKCFSKPFWEIWNQSGMDHELIGHIYNFYAGWNSEESGAIRTQLYLFNCRAKIYPFWKQALAIETGDKAFNESRALFIAKINAL